MFCVIVKVQDPFCTPGHPGVPEVTMGGPQQNVAASPCKAKGVTVTGTQMLDVW